MDANTKTAANDQVIQIMISRDLKQKISEVADSYRLKGSTLGRIILERHINDYNKNRLFS